MPAALIHRSVVRHWMNARVRAIRAGRVPQIPGLKHTGPTREEAADVT